MKLKTMAACALTFAAATSALQAQNVTYTYAYNGPALPIFRDSANIITIANVFVPRAVRITKVTANVEIDYPHPGDLNIYMYSPILTRTKLLERNCGNQGSVADVTFDDAAPTRYSDVCPSSPGSYRGNEPLSNYNGQVALGTWSLAAENNGTDASVGYLRGFTVVITGTAITNQPVTGPNAIFNVAGLQSGTVAPGEMITIQGVNMGPSPAVSAPAGDLPANLGGVQVTFDGGAAALSYVSPYELTVQAPFSLQPGKSTELRVLNQNTTSDAVSLPVASVVPGVYTESADGRGLVTAVNPDGSLNSPGHPAPTGQMVVIYAAGLGTVTPALAAGQTPPGSPISNTTTTVTAMVDGMSAPVLFAGAAPGYPGLYQINLQIPSTARSGGRSLMIFADGASSQLGVTIFVQ